MNKTKIVCTIGPASDKKTTLKKMVQAGMNVVRLNFSHNVQAYHLDVIKKVRAISNELNKPIAIIQDLQGPRIRLGDLPKAGYNLKKGEQIILSTASRTKKGTIPVTYKQMHKDVQAGERIFITDGIIKLKVIKKKATEIFCEVIIGGHISSHKGINLPDTNVLVSSLSEKDKKDLEFGIKNQVDYVALSFVRGASEVFQLRELIKKIEKKKRIKANPPIKIIVKIEGKEAIDNLDEILESTDAVMVARGDLGVELPAENVPLMQKMIIDKCLTLAKPVIVATQMLDSMIDNSRPTRAEVSDVANAVIDHTDAVMLSGETATGKYPIEAVTYMRKIVEKTENSTYDDLVVIQKIKKIAPINEAVSSVAKSLADQVKVKFILVASISGHSGRIVSRYRPEKTIFVATAEERVKRQLCLTWGVRPFVLPKCTTNNQFIEKAENYLIKNKLAQKGDSFIVIGGVPIGKSGNLNLIEIRVV